MPNTAASRTGTAVKNREDAPEFRPGRKNVCCRKCFLADGYQPNEDSCHFCGAEIYEIDSV